MPSLLHIAEARIQDAIDSGELMPAGLKGKPLDLDAYFAMPASVRAGFQMLKDAGVVPPEVDALRAVGELKERISCEIDEAKSHALIAELRVRETELAMALERMKKLRRADAV